MIEYRKASDRFETRMEWLDSRHSFSFGHHYDPNNTSFGPLRVLNEDWIDAHSGFPTHPHREMEILTYVMAGALSHRDSEGSDDTMRPGLFQLMHAGTGIAHSEINHGDRPVHLLQIWIEPDRKGTAPGYEILDYTLTPSLPTVLASSDEAAGGLHLRQDATVSALKLEAGQTFAWPLVAQRRGWIQVAAGSGEVSSLPFESGDAFAIDEIEVLKLAADIDAEFLLFDLPGNETGAQSRPTPYEQGMKKWDCSSMESGRISGTTPKQAEGASFASRAPFAIACERTARRLSHPNPGDITSTSRSPVLGHTAP